jgi:3-phosphoshikimate 1-carboxyvinyltransferase
MPQTITPIKGPIHTNIVVPGSKSITNRALLLAALADGVSEISGLSLSDETKTLINALHQLGIVAQLNEKAQSCIVAG